MGTLKEPHMVGSENVGENAVIRDTFRGLHVAVFGSDHSSLLISERVIVDVLCSMCVPARHNGRSGLGFQKGRNGRAPCS